MSHGIADDGEPDDLDPDSWEDAASWGVAAKVISPEAVADALATRAFGRRRGRPARRPRSVPIDLDLFGLVVNLAFQGRAKYGYEYYFDFPTDVVLAQAGATLQEVLSFSPHDTGCCTFGLTRVSLDQRGYLMRWHQGDDKNVEWIVAAWEPANAEALYEAAVCRAFASCPADIGHPLMNPCRKVLNFACAPIALDQLWQQQSERSWTRWVKNFLEWDRETIGERTPEVNIDKLTDAGIKAPVDFAEFIKSLRTDRSTLLKAIAAGTLTRQQQHELVLLRWLVEHSAVFAPAPPLDPTPIHHRAGTPKDGEGTVDRTNLEAGTILTYRTPLWSVGKRAVLIPRLLQRQCCRSPSSQSPGLTAPASACPSPPARPVIVRSAPTTGVFDRVLLRNRMFDWWFCHSGRSHCISA
jgi:hypothetical protein